MQFISFLGQVHSSRLWERFWFELQTHIFNMVQQWLLKIGGEINNGNMELQRQVCTCRNLLDCFLPWLRVFFQGKTKSWLIEVGDWEGKMGTYIITQMIFSGFLNEVCYCIWNEVSAMIKSFWDLVIIFTLYSVYWKKFSLNSVNHFKDLCWCPWLAEGLTEMCF